MENPKYSEKSLNSHEIFSQHKLFKEASVECLIFNYRLDVRTASCLNIPDNAVFPLFRIERLNQSEKQLLFKLKKTSINLNGERGHILNIRQIETQTYAYAPTSVNDSSESFTLDYDIEAANKSAKEKCIEDLIFNVFVRNKSEEKLLIWEFVSCLEKLSESSIRYLNDYFSHQISNEAAMRNIPHIKSITKLSEEKLSIFDILVVKLTKSEPNLDLEKILKLVQSKQKDVRFETSLEKKRVARERFKRIVRFIMCNREFNKEIIEKRERFLLEKYDIDFLDCRKIGLLFNKEEFKAQKSLSNLITDIHRNILVIPPQVRTLEQSELLIELV